MRKFSIILAVFCLLAMTSCRSADENVELRDGTYFLIGDYREGMTPYIGLSTEDHTFAIGGGTLLSLQERGSYEIINGQLIATTLTYRFVLDVKSAYTLVLTEFTDLRSNERFTPLNATFIHNGS